MQQIKNQEVCMKFHFERKIDNLGRLVLPKDIRRLFEISENMRLYISVEEDKIIITKNPPDEDKTS